MRARLAFSLLIASAALAATPASALAGSGDVAATQAYVKANYALVRVGNSHILASEAAARGILHQVQRECPAAAASSPQNPSSTELSNELIGALILAAGHIDRPAIHTYIRTVSNLHWSSGSLTRSIQSYVRKLETLSKLTAPAMCADVKAWAASGYETLPASTAGFAPKFMDAWVALGYLPRQLGAFESPQLRALAARSEKFESNLTEGEARGAETWAKAMDALELLP